MLHRLVDAPLDPSAVIAAVAGDDAGAVVSFVGTVRGASRGRRVVRLEYEAYEAMALTLFDALAAEAALRFGGARVVVHHRLGRCGVGEPTVAIAAASPHRAEAFDACRFAIERLKADVPIWKREVYDDGAVWVGMGS